MIDTAVPPASTPAQTAAPAGALPATEVDAASPPVQFSGPDQAVRRATPAAQSRPVAPTLGKDVALCSVLPFLVLGMLRRIGWLEVASATFEALAMPDRGAVFATALAYKLLPPPRKGWHRNPEILRTAAALRVDHLWLTGATAPPDHERTRRTALGSERFLTWDVVEDPVGAATAAREAGYRVVGVELADGAVAIHEADLDGDICLALGHEDRGLSAALLGTCDAVVFIPQLGRIGSLNVATAAAVAMYEVRRRAWTTG